MSIVYPSLYICIRETRVTRKHVFIPAAEGHLPGPVDAMFLRLVINLPRPRQKIINYESLVTLQYVNINLITICNLSNVIIFHGGMLIFGEFSLCNRSSNKYVCIKSRILFEINVDLVYV
jgi:hypothetical protein